MIAERYRDEENTADILNKALDEAKAATNDRNVALHSVWIRPDGKDPVLHDRRTCSVTSNIRFLPLTVFRALVRRSSGLGAVSTTLRASCCQRPIRPMQ